MTQRLYYEDSHIRTFEATVLSCTQAESGWRVVLDRTAFFPEGGGQLADRGTLGAANVLDVHLAGDGIVHVTNAPLAPGSMAATPIASPFMIRVRKPPPFFCIIDPSARQKAPRLIQ